MSAVFRSSPSRRLNHFSIAIICLVLLFLGLVWRSRSATVGSVGLDLFNTKFKHPTIWQNRQKRLHVTLVVASQSKDNTTWLANAFPSWEKMIYVTDNPTAALTVPANKGREAMVYLTYV